jgi:hypothetical protein
MGDAEFEAAFAEGRSLTLDEAIDLIGARTGHR